MVEFLYTAGDAGSQHLFAQAFAPTDVSTLPATDISDTAATLNGSANPGGAAILTHFDFGATTAYGNSTADDRLDVASIATAFDALVSGLTPSATVHFRAVALSEFKRFVRFSASTESRNSATPESDSLSLIPAGG